MTSTARTMRVAAITGAFVAAMVALPPCNRRLDAQQRDSVRRDSTHTVRLPRVFVASGRLSPTDKQAPARVDDVDVGAAASGPAGAIEAISKLTGVSMLDDQGSRLQMGFNIRGFRATPTVGEPQGVSVFLDGVRINEPDAQEINFDLIPMESVARAEFVRGPSALFGKNTLGGALLLYTERGASPARASAEVEGGSFGYRSARVSVAGGWRGIDGLMMARGSDESGWRQDTPARTRMVFANVGRRKSDDQDTSDVALTLLYARDRIFEAGSLPESYLQADRRINYTGGDFFAPELVHVALRGQRGLAGGTGRANIFFRRNAFEQFNVNVPPPNTDAIVRNLSYGSALEWVRDVTIASLPLSVSVGGEYSRSDVRYRVYATSVVPTDSLPVACDATSGLCTSARVKEDDVALFAQGVLGLTPGLAATLAVRADYVRVPFRDLRAPENDGTTSLVRFSPRVGLTYQLSKTSHVYSAVSTGFRAPAALELACASETAPCSLPSVLGADPPLDPVKVVNYETGVSIEPTTRTSVDVSAFRSDVYDDILFVASSLTQGYFRNVSRTRREGVELSGTARLPHGLRAFAAQAFLNARYLTTVRLASAIDGAEPVRPGDHFPLSPSFNSTVGIGASRLIRGSAIDAEVSVKAVSSQFMRGDEANAFAPVPGYAVGDVRIVAVNQRFNVTVRLANIFDQRYETFGVYVRREDGAGQGDVPAFGANAAERFLTPGHPRSITIAVALTR